jgi:hypothetical protein
MFTRSLYVQVRKNEFLVRNIDDARSFREKADPAFSHPRSLLGNFTAAGNCLKSAVSRSLGNRFAASTAMLIHPLETIEGGLSQIEERAFREIALFSGASKAVVWVGEDLSDTEVLSKLESASGRFSGWPAIGAKFSRLFWLAVLLWLAWRIVSAWLG